MCAVMVSSIDNVFITFSFSVMHAVSDKGQHEIFARINIFRVIVALIISQILGLDELISKVGRLGLIPGCSQGAIVQVAA